MTDLQKVQQQAQQVAMKINEPLEAASDELERKFLRKFNLEAMTCAVDCYKKAGTSAPRESLIQCEQACQNKARHAMNLMQSVRGPPASGDMVYRYSDSHSPLCQPIFFLYSLRN